MPSSKYALKMQGKITPKPNTRMRRCCDSCGRQLSGRKGHGFPSRDGRRIFGICCVLGVGGATDKRPMPHILGVGKRYNQADAA